MSIINDALKKAQKNLSSQKDKNILKPGIDQTDPNASSNPLIGSAKGDHVKLLIIFSLFAIIICMIVILFLVMNKKSEPSVPSIHPNMTKVQTKSTAPKTSDATKGPGTPSAPMIPSPPLRQQTSLPEKVLIEPQDFDKPLVLDGIMTIDNNKFALINGDDYEEGELIYGMEIISISGKKVEIQTLDGKIIELNVKGK